MLYDFLPINTEIEWEYNTDIDKYGWVRTTYKNLTGWVFALNPKYIDDESEIANKVREEYFNILKYGEVKEVTPTPTNTPVPIITNAPDEQYPNQEERQPEVPNQAENGGSGIVLIICGVVVIIVLIIIVIIIMSKKSYKLKMPKKDQNASKYNAFDNFEAYQQYNNQNNNRR